MMTDEQIMQRLEFKRGEIGVQVCIDHDLLDETINLINRREAKIKRLEEQCADKERAYNEEYCLRKELKTELKTTKSEAIKEFAEKLKKRFYLSAGRCVVDVYHIDKFAKDMTRSDDE